MGPASPYERPDKRPGAQPGAQPDKRPGAQPDRRPGDRPYEPGDRPAGRVAYRREVGAEHLGQRVTVRWQDQHGVTRDVVGRLAALDDEVMIITDRSAAMRVVDARRVIASKLIPAHPRRAPEPAVGSRDIPVERDAARMLILDEGRALLIAHHPRVATTVWTAPGGGIGPDEHARQAAEREVNEELGVLLRAGPLVLRRSTTFCFRGVWITQHETWFLADPEPSTSLDTTLAALAARPDSTAPADVATSTVRWWTSDEITNAHGAADPTPRFEPPELGQFVTSIAAHGPPDQPWELEHAIREP